MTERSAMIAEYFREAMGRVGGLALPLDPERWEAEAPEDPSNLHRPFGWMPPYQRVPRLFVLRLCPTIIAAQTTHLDDTKLTEYLDAIAFCVNLHITHWERTPEDREALITRTLYDVGPGSMSLLTRVQMRALDTALEARNDS